MTRLVNWRSFSTLVVLCFLAGPGVADAAPFKSFTLTNGRVVVGEVVDEGESAFLIRGADGEVLRIPYAELRSVIVVGAGESETPSAAAAPRFASGDAFFFEDREQKARYEVRRIQLEVLDASSGSWYAQSYALPSVGTLGVGVSSAGGRYVSSVVAQYRMSTGEGLVLTTVVGGYLADAQKLFGFMGMDDAFLTHQRTVGVPRHERAPAARRKGSFILAATGGFTIALVGAGMMLGAHQESTYGAGTAILVGGGSTFTFFAIKGAATAVPELEHLVHQPWTVEETLPFVRSYNEALRSELGAL